MRTFLIRLIIFSTLFAAILLASTEIIDRGLKKTGYRDYACWNDIVASRINADVLFLGSSRAETHFNPVVFEDAWSVDTYNIGLSGYQFDMTYNRFKVYLEHNKKPGAIILSVDQRGYFQSTTGLYNKHQFLPYLENTTLRNKLTKIGLPAYYSYLPFLKYQECKTAPIGIMEFFRIKHIPPQTEQGFYPHRRGWNPILFERLKSTVSEIAVQWDNETVDELEQFLAYCKEEGIFVAMVYTPKFYEAREMEVGYELLELRIAELGQKYSAPIIDYYKSPICKDTKYFYNALHLNLEGANLFSEQLANELALLPDWPFPKAASVKNKMTDKTLTSLERLPDECPRLDS